MLKIITMKEINILAEDTNQTRSGCRVLYGEHAAASYLLQAAAEISIERPVHLLDFGNRCDMYFTARQLRYLTRDPVAAMRNIHLQRAFTCYQAAALLRQLSDLDNGKPVIILDLLAPYLDENVKTAEIYRLFHDAVEQLHFSMQNRLLLIGVKPVPQKLAPDRVCLVSNIARSFGLIPVDVQYSTARLSGETYQQRPASHVWLSRGSRAGKRKPELNPGQPPLFNDDLLNR